MQHTPFARQGAAIVALIATAAIVIQIIAERSMDGLALGEALWGMARYLTVLTNALAAGTFAVIALNLRPVSPRWIAGLMIWMGLVALGFHLLLAATVEFSGLKIWSDLGFHTLAPALTALFWLALTPKGSLRLLDIGLFLSWPALYLAYALLRGLLDGKYPYEFIDPTVIGWTGVAVSAVGFSAAIALAGAVIVALDKVLPGRGAQTGRAFTDN